MKTTMTIVLALDAEREAVLLREARERGLSPEDVLVMALEHLAAERSELSLATAEDADAARWASLREILSRPMTEEEGRRATAALESLRFDGGPPHNTSKEVDAWVYGPATTGQ